MALYRVLEEAVPVEELRPGDTLILSGGRRVSFERVDEFDGACFVRWYRPADRGEPGHKGRAWNRNESITASMDGRYLGSMALMHYGENVRVDRA